MEKLVRPVFTLDINYKIIPGLVTIGKYDGTHPCLTAATTADKILIHSPHRRNTSATGRVIWSESNKEIATLNINQTITALVAGILLVDDKKDILIVGTPTHVLAYHVHDNRDIFYKECSDGVKSITLGLFNSNTTPILLVGGNSSVLGIDQNGEEIFWIAVGDVVTSMVLMDYDKDGSNELLVSSEDYNIRVFKGDRCIGEQVETEVVTGLLALPEYKYAYGVSNGTVGVYEIDVRLWRVKSKNFPIALHGYDLLGQSSLQLITGWSNGKIDCRSIQTGEVFFKDNMNSGVAGIVEGDYRSIGKNDVICVSVEGEVRGYTTTKTLTAGNTSGVEQDTVRQLLEQKQALMMELKHYENNTKYNENAPTESESYENSGVIPANTRLQVAISTNEKAKQPHVEVYVCTNNATIIRATIIFAEGIFKGETHVIHPELSKVATELSVPLYIPKDNSIDIHIKAFVGYPTSIQYHVFEITRQLPRFAMYAVKDQSADKTQPEGNVQFKINERLQRICMWINQNFLLASEVEMDNSPKFSIHMKCLRDNSDLTMNFEISGKATIHTNNMSLAADLIQSLTTYLKVDHLESKASFPAEEDNLAMLMQKLNDIQDARMKLGTDVADKLVQIRSLIIKAEDCRVNDLKEMSKQYNELNNVNKDLINGYNIRLQNYNEGVEAMKKINSIIQRASRLRVGKGSSNMINHCRNCIKNNSVEGLIKVIRSGSL